MEEFLQTQKQAQHYLAQYNDSTIKLNHGVTLSYNKIANSDPLFVWFSAATLGSSQVGKVIETAQNPLFTHIETLQIISKGFSYGNQEIHNNIVPLFMTYRSKGVAGLQSIHQDQGPQLYVTQNLIDSFKIMESLESKAKVYAAQVGLPVNDPKVVKYVMSNKANLQLLKQATIQLVQHEQMIVQPMYEISYSQDGKTVGEALKSLEFIQPINNALQISGAKILDTFISAEGYDFSDYSQRMEFFTKVLDEYFNVLGEDGGFDKLAAQRAEIIAGLGTIFLNDGGLYPFVSSVHTYDSESHQWKEASKNISPIKGIWVPPETYPEIMSIVSEYPVILNTVYSFQNCNYLYTTADHLPNLPKPNYSWHSIKAFLKVASYGGYENEGSLWVILNTSTQKFVTENEFDMMKLISDHLV